MKRDGDGSNIISAISRSGTDRQSNGGNDFYVVSTCIYLIPWSVHKMLGAFFMQFSSSSLRLDTRLGLGHFLKNWDEQSGMHFLWKIPCSPCSPAEQNSFFTNRISQFNFFLKTGFARKPRPENKGGGACS